MRILNTKRCPRCNLKMDKNLISCPSCQLNFDKFETATNAEAKQAIKQGETDRVLMRKGCPYDVNRVKLSLLTIFLGFTGAHLFYVGRYKMGMFYFIFFIVGLTNAILQSYFKIDMSSDIWQVFVMMTLIWAVVVILWMIDIINVAFNKFKIPVSRN